MTPGARDSPPGRRRIGGSAEAGRCGRCGRRRCRGCSAACAWAGRHTGAARVADLHPRGRRVSPYTVSDAHFRPGWRPRDRLQGADPEQDRGDGDGGLVGLTGLVVASGRPAPLLETTEAALDDIAAAVDASVEAGRSAAARTSVQSTEDLVGEWGSCAGYRVVAARRGSFENCSPCRQRPGRVGSAVARARLWAR